VFTARYGMSSNGSGGQTPASHRGESDSILGQSM
jgi:hypothetical protein